MQKKSIFIKTFLWLVFLLAISTAQTKAAAPILLTSTPADNAIGVSTTIGITLIFDQPVFMGVGSYQVNCTGPGMCLSNMSFCSNFSGSGTTTLTLAETYTANKNYNLQFDTTCFRNAAMQYWAGINNTTDLNFSTGAAPGACTFTNPCFSPLDNATNVPVASNLTVTFDVPWDYADSYRDFEVRRVSDDSLVFSYPFNSPEITGAGTTVFTVNPATDLPSETALYVNFDAIKKQIGVGQYEIPNFDKTTWNFNTADITPPNCTVTLSPLDNATGVALNANLVMTCSENVQIGTGNIVITHTGVGTFESIPITDPRVSIVGNTITINPTGTFASLTNYHVTIAAGVIEDTSGNDFAGISGNTTWNFITSGNSPGWYSGNWGRRIKITVDSTQVGIDLNNFPVYVDLSDLAPSFFANTQTDGADIRVTLNDGLTAVPHELVNINTGASTGELYFRATNLSSTVDNDFYIYYDNPNARMINGADELGFQRVWSNNYVAVYHMQQLPGNSNAKLWDSTTNRNHGIPNGGMINANLVTGKTGGALDFDGSDDHLQISDSASLNSASGTGQPRSVSYWLNTLEAGNTVIMEKGSNSNFTQKTNTGAVIAGTNTTLINYANSSTSINDGSWHFVTHSYTGTANNLYVDSAGTPEDTSVETAAAANTNPLTIGASIGGTNAYDGLLDEIRISNVERSPEWIHAEYVNINTPGTFYSVAAEELVTDTSDPKITILYSANKSVQHPTSHNLKIFFSEVVNTNTGFITIRSFDDSVFEALDVTDGARVAGSGSSEITLIPTTNFEEGTKYYVLIDPTAIEDASSNAFSGIFDKETWTFTTQGRNSIKKQQLFILDGN